MNEGGDNPNGDSLTSTPEVFAEKWNRWSKLLFEEESARNSGILDWVLRRNGWSSTAQLREFLENRSSILDAGCGNGRITKILAENAIPKGEVFGWDINPTVAAGNLADKENVTVQMVDLSSGELPSTNFDFIYCQEVLHHLPEPKGTFLRLSQLLSPGGTIAIYVYGLKGPVREFADERIRDVFTELDEEGKEKFIEAITSLGKQLAQIEQEVTIEGLESIGFRSGTFPVQKFVYDNLMKCFWNENLGIDGSKAINFDWYAPSLASKHTLPEVLEWVLAAGLELTHHAQDEYGITVHGRKAH